MPSAGGGGEGERGRERRVHTAAPRLRRWLHHVALQRDQTEEQNKHEASCSFFQTAALLCKIFTVEILEASHKLAAAGGPNIILTLDSTVVMTLSVSHYNC